MKRKSTLQRILEEHNWISDKASTLESRPSSLIKRIKRIMYKIFTNEIVIGFLLSLLLISLQLFAAGR